MSKLLIFTDEVFVSTKISVALVRSMEAGNQQYQIGLSKNFSLTNLVILAFKYTGFACSYVVAYGHAPTRQRG